MSDTKIKTSNIGNLAVTHALLHTDMDLTSKTVQVATPTSNTHPATKLYVDTEVANLIDSAPGTLDTLNELAAAVNDDANFNATIASSIATKLPLAGGTMTGNLQIYKAEPIITLQRSNNALLPGISWQGSGGTEAASIKLDGTSGTTNTLIMSTYNGSTMAERLRLMTNAAGGIAVTGTISVTGTVDGVDIAARDAILTSTTTTADAALPKAGGTLTGTLNVTQASTADTIKLTRGTTSHNNMIKFVTGSTNKWIVGQRNDNTDHFRFYSYGTSNDVLSIQTDGNVGIGTSSPGEKLEVNGSFKIGNLKIQNANGGRIGFNRNTANGDIYDSNFAAFQINGAYSGADFMAFEAYTSGGVGTDAMAIKSNGNIGIGTTDPTSKLQVAGGNGISLKSTTSPATPVAGEVQLWQEGNGLVVRGENSGSAINFSVRAKDNTTRMVVTGGGNVGIGTSSPDTNLHVFKASAGTITNWTNNALVVENSGDVGISLLTPNSDAGHLMFGSPGNEYHSYIRGGYGASTTSTLKFFTDDINTMTHKAGNVGIGTDSPNESLHIYRASGDASFKLQHASQTLRIDQNSIRTSTSSPLAMFTNNTSSYGFRIEDDGRMIIGANGGQSNVKLTVAGNVKMGSAATSSWANTINDLGGLDVIVGSGSHALQLWDDNSQGQPRFEVERAGKVTMGTTIHLHEARYNGAFNVSGTSQDYNLMMPSFYGAGSINQTYRHAYTINTPFHTTLWQGGGGNTVFTTWSKIGAEHYKDIYVETYTLYYSDIKIKVVTDGNANISVWYAGATYNNNVYSARWRVYPLQACSITMNPSSSQSAVHMVHYASGGRQETSTDTATAGSGPSTW
jgi:hypothetical protein